MPDQPYVTFPGTAGNYISTPDVNLLDADTAHLVQGTGSWEAYFGGGSTVFGLSPEQQVFGATSIKCDVAGTNGNANSGLRAVDVAISGATEYAVSVSVFVTTAQTMTFAVEQRTSGGAPVGTLQSVEYTATPNTWERQALTFTTEATAAFFYLYVWRDGANDATVFYVDAVCVRTGSDTSFVPSLRIVGDLDFGIDQSRADWTGNQVYLLSNWITAAAPFRLITVGTTGNLLVTLTINGVERNIGNTAVPTSGRHVIRVTRDKDTGFTSLTLDGSQTDGLTFDPGDPIDYTESSNLSIGNAIGSIVNQGDVFYAWLRDGIDGPIVALFDAADVGGVL